MAKSLQHEENLLKKENSELRKKIDDLEQVLGEMDADRSRVGESDDQTIWQKRALFAVILLAGIIPAYFVVQDRWLEKSLDIESLDDLWGSMSVLETLAYPHYFLVIFICVLFTWLVVLLWRKGPFLAFSNLSIGSIVSSDTQANTRQTSTGRYLILSAVIIGNISLGVALFTGRIPSWELLLALALYVIGWGIREYPLAVIQQYFQLRGRFLLDAAVFVIALCSMLYALYGESKPNMIFFPLFALAAINFLRHRKETPAIFWVSIASLIALTWKINGWEYVVIGDEYSFYIEIRNILENRTAWELINTTFNGNFVYGTHPYFSSYIHNFFMKLFDNHNFGWRFSNPVLVASSLFFFYYFFKVFIPQRTALITVILLGASHYLMSFSKIGYNNLQALFALGIVLATFAWALKSMRVAAFVLLGLAIGLCFYLYPAALYITPLPMIGLLIFLPPNNKDALKRWGWMLVSMSLLVYPLIVQLKYWEAKIAGTFFYTDVSTSAGALIQNIIRNSLYTSLSFLYTPEQSHYVSIGYMDPISSVFIVIGIAYLIKLTFSKNPSALFLALSFLTLFFFVGATHGRNFPTATRMFLLLPWFALFAAYGLEWCAEKASQLFNANNRGVITVLTSLIVITNLYHAYVVDIRNMPQYHSLAPMFVKTLREINADSSIPPKSYYFVAPPGWNTDGMEIIQKVYLIPESPRQIVTLPVEDDRLPESASAVVSERDNIIIVKGDMDGNIMAQVDAQLEGWGKSMCEIRNGGGTLQFQLWHSGDLGWLCQ
jgi:hypothetical protein